MKRHGRSAGILVAFTMMAGCGGAQAPSPSSESSPISNRSPSSTSSDKRPNVPKVANPIDTAAFEQQPCSVLTTSQLRDLSISTEPESKTTESGPGCEWGDVFDDGMTIEGTFLTKAGSSVAVVYKNRQYGTYAYFEPTEISGYPAVFNNVADGRETGGCAISIGLRDKLIYTLSMQLGEDRPSYSDPCQVLDDIAEMAVKTMTQGSS